MIREQNPVRKLNRVYDPYGKGVYHTYLHEELSQVLMNIWDNSQWITSEMIDEISKLYSIRSSVRLRAENGLWTPYPQRELNIALMSIWVEQERTVPTQEFIDNLKKFIL